MITGVGKFVVPLFLVAVLAGCTVAPKSTDDAVKPVPTLDVFMAEANALFQAGQVDKAQEVVKKAANSYPAEKTPWLRMAQIRFDRSDYGEAIVNALEVLQRDPKDSIANSLIAVSGLRLSTKALADLRNQNELSGDVRTEAQELAKVLRENVGEAVLVPPPPKAGAGKAGKIVVKPRLRSAETGAPRPTVAPVEAARNANPFGALK